MASFTRAGRLPRNGCLARRRNTGPVGCEHCSLQGVYGSGMLGQNMGGRGRMAGVRSHGFLKSYFRDVLRKGGKSYKARFVRYLEFRIPSEQEQTPTFDYVALSRFSGSADKDLPSGAWSSLWEVPGLVDVSTSSYVAVTVRQTLSSTTGLNGFGAQVTPVVTRSSA